MNILFERSQSHSTGLSLIPLRIGGGVVFELRARLEFTVEEKQLLDKYGFSDAALTNSDTSQDLARAYKPSVLFGFVAAILTALLFHPPQRGLDGLLIKIGTIPSVGIVTTLILTILYFFSLREYISVGQLLGNGRKFFCHSVVELNDKEEHLRQMARQLHATLEKAKNWGGREINPIPNGAPYYNVAAPAPTVAIPSPVESTLYKAGQIVGGLKQSPQEPQPHNIQPPPRNPTSPAPQAPQFQRHPLSPKPPNDDSSGSI